MLSWTEAEDEFRADGYVIRLIAPFHWVLEESTADQQSSVRLIAEPLATTRTLSDAKRQAEILHEASRRSELCRRWFVALIVAVAGLAFTVGSPPPGGFIASILLAAIALRSIGLLAGLALSRFTPRYEDFMYQ